MKHIDTTQSRINHIKSLAKKLKKEKGIQLCKAQEEVARQLGYDNFYHVHHCFKNTRTSQSILEY
jgi:hypothetical protein